MTFSAQVDEDGNCPTCKRSMQLTYAPPSPDVVGAQPVTQVGCICPPGANETCQNPTCPRRNWSNFSIA